MKIKMNEFYVVELTHGEAHYFKNKDKAFEFLWQAYLNLAEYDTEEDVEIARECLNEYYYIDGIGDICVIGFED